MLLIFDKKGYLREETGSALSAFAMPNNIWIYSTKNGIWWYRSLNANKKVLETEVPTEYRVMVLLLNI